MRLCRKFLAILLLILVPVYGSTQDNSVLGIWCSIETGETIYLDEFGIGFNEHTICDSQFLPSDTRTFRSYIFCKNVYDLDGEIVETGHATLAFAVELESENSLSVSFSGDVPTTQYARCGEGD